MFDTYTFTITKEHVFVDNTEMYNLIHTTITDYYKELSKSFAKNKDNYTKEDLLIMLKTHTVPAPEMLYNLFDSIIDKCPIIFQDRQIDELVSILYKLNEKLKKKINEQLTTY